MAAAGDLARRVAVAAVGVPFGIWVIALGGWPLGLVLGAVAVGSAHEFFGLARARGAAPFAGPGMLAAGLLAATPLLYSGSAERLLLPIWSGVVLLFLGVAGAAVFLRGVEGRPFEAITSTLTGVVYTGGTLSFAGLLRGLAGGEPLAGAALLIFPLLVTWIGDTFAYFGGRAWGRHKLAPKVSPKKTVEGALAGLAGSAAAGGLFAGFALQRWEPAVSVGAAILIAVVLGAVGQIGDLAESVLKREAGVKDSGTLLPGHGGLLDRFDAIFFTVPVAYGLFRLWGLG
ncbi:MAG: phosphatidate cytidylyltransferase [Gemmatimonadota bacterium]